MSKRVLSIDIGIVNLAFCVIDFHHYEMLESFDVVHLEKACIGTMKQSSKTLVENMIDIFRESEVIHTHHIDHIFIEQQVSRAVKNSILSYSALAYFYSSMSNSTSVCFVSPKKKFTAVKDALGGSGCLDGVNFDVSGRNLKKLSVDVARKVFHHFKVEPGLRALEVYRPKLDDVCDVFLQGFAVVYSTSDYSK
jgi:hypothetical protein